MKNIKSFQSDELGPLLEYPKNNNKTENHTKKTGPDRHISRKHQRTHNRKNTNIANHLTDLIEIKDDILTRTALVSRILEEVTHELPRIPKKKKKRHTQTIQRTSYNNGKMHC